MMTCEACGYENADNSEFCEACGAELTVSTVPPTMMQPSETVISNDNDNDPFDPNSSNNDNFDLPIEQSFPNPIPTPQPAPTPVQTQAPPPATFGAAKLITKTPNAPISEFPLDGTNLLIGRFDPDTGPVDVDLEGFPGEDTISRNHAEIYQEGGQWKIKDLGSTNGVFLKRTGQSRFGARITMPETLNAGDEVAIAKIRFLFQTA